MRCVEIEQVGGLDVSGRGIFDVDVRDHVVSGSDLPQPPLPGSLDQPRQQVVVSGTPDQVGPQCDGGEAMRSVGRQHVGFGNRLGAGVVAQERAGQGGAFVGVDHVAAVEDDTGAGGVDEASDPGVCGRGDQVAGPLHIDRFVQRPRAPDPRHAGAVKNGHDVATGLGDRCGVSHVTAEPADPFESQAPRFAAAKDPHLVASSHQLFNEEPAQKASTSGNQVAHA